MSKRFIFQQQTGDRKKAKLNVTISDHNFPLSQNKDNENTWGDENDDEMLLMASQACEDACSSNDISTLLSYSCMQPATTSTQLDQPGPSYQPFNFKKPISNTSNIITTSLKSKCNIIASPFTVTPNSTLKANKPNMTVDLIFNEDYKGQDTDYIYRQLLQLQEDNAKLKSENGKLLEKCVTKEGEASILRTQLKTCQVAVDQARLEKIKTQEKVQMEWTEKLKAANNQLQELRTQLDFKNLEIVSAKERCRMLESSKVKLTQVTVSNTDMLASSSRLNNSQRRFNSSQRKFNNTQSSLNSTLNESIMKPPRAKMTTNSVQTEDKVHFLKLNKTCRLEPSKLTQILPLLFEPTTDQQPSILEYNEKLTNTDNSLNKCRVFNNYHRLPSTPAQGRKFAHKVTMGSVYEDVLNVALEGNASEKYGKILTTIRSVLNDIQCELEDISHRMTTAFHSEMDDKYIENTTLFSVVDERDLLSGRALYKEEQAILGRRMVAILYYLVKNSNVDIFKGDFMEVDGDSTNVNIPLIDVISRICSLIDSTSCATLYSGLLLSIVLLIENLPPLTPELSNTKILEIVKTITISRPMIFVSCDMVRLLRRYVMINGFTSKLCPGNSIGNLKMDYDQGVLLYKKDSCILQILLKQVESALKCIEKQNLVKQAIETTSNLIALHSDTFGDKINVMDEKTICDCKIVFMQVIVYALRICAVKVKGLRNTELSQERELLSVCKSGIHLLYQCSIRDVEFNSQLGYNEGHLVEMCEIMKEYRHDEVYSTMLSELCCTFQSTSEEAISSYTKHAWLRSFETFALTD